MFRDEEILLPNATDTQYVLPAYQAITENPTKGLLPIGTVLVVSFFCLRWLMKG